MSLMKSASVVLTAIKAMLMGSPWSAEFNSNFGAVPPTPTPTPVPTPPPPPTPVPTPIPIPIPAWKPSPNRTVVYAGSSSAITDGYGNRWTIVHGVVNVNGKNAGYTANVVKIAYVNSVIWHKNINHLWWSWSGITWTPSRGTHRAPL